MLLSDEELEQISGGRDLVFPEGYCHLHGRFSGSQCPLCNSQ
jgi:bacteriocin-like protein